MSQEHKPGPTFMTVEEIIERHKDGTLNERQAIVALARTVGRLQEDLSEIAEIALSYDLAPFERKIITSKIRSK